MSETKAVPEWMRRAVLGILVMPQLNKSRADLEREACLVLAEAYAPEQARVAELEQNLDHTAGLALSLKNTADALLGRLQTLLSLLKRVEWVWSRENFALTIKRCPICENALTEGHNSDCELSKALQPRWDDAKVTEQARLRRELLKLADSWESASRSLTKSANPR